MTPSCLWQRDKSCLLPPTDAACHPGASLPCNDPFRGLGQAPCQPSGQQRGMGIPTGLGQGPRQPPELPNPATTELPPAPPQLTRSGISTVSGCPRPIRPVRSDPSGAGRQGAHLGAAEPSRAVSYQGGAEQGRDGAGEAGRDRAERGGRVLPPHRPGLPERRAGTGTRSPGGRGCSGEHGDRGTRRLAGHPRGDGHGWARCPRGGTGGSEGR